MFYQAISLFKFSFALLCPQSSYNNKSSGFVVDGVGKLENFISFSFLVQEAFSFSIYASVIVIPPDIEHLDRFAFSLILA
jgi:hypothetical protein